MTAHRSPNNRGSSKTIQQQPDAEAESTLVSRALQSAGGAGGISGTGQASPHHGFDDDDGGRQAAANPAGDEARLPMPETGSSYQTGGTHLNRDRQAETRKDRLAGGTIASAGRGGFDSAPGAPVRRG